MRLKSRDQGTDDPDGEHPAIHQVCVVVLVSDDADGTVGKDQEECRRDRYADCKSVRAIACLSHHHFTGDTRADQQGAEDCKIGHTPDHLIGELHRDQRQHQQERSSGPAHYPPGASSPSGTAVHVASHCPAFDQECPCDWGSTPGSLCPRVPGSDAEIFLMNGLLTADHPDRKSVV